MIISLPMLMNTTVTHRGDISVVRRIFTHSYAFPRIIWQDNGGYPDS